MNQRRLFADTLYERMKTDESIRLIVGDLGYGVFNDHFKDFPDRCFNSGAAEVTMINMAVGMALSGLKPICYSITPFLLWRPAEQIRIYLNHEQIPVTLVGSGRKSDYANQGYSHDANDDANLMIVLPDIDPYWPESDDEVIDALDEALKGEYPHYINLTR